jgi:beta-lactamase regulating signal transducer with metallopeptidase domain
VGAGADALAWVPVPEEAPAVPEPVDPPAAGPPVVPDFMPTQPAEVAGGTGLDLPAVLLAVYAAVAVLLLVKWLAGYVALLRLLRAARPAPAALADWFAEVAPGRRPRLLVSERARVPFSCGLLRPTVVLPAALAAGGPSGRLRWVLTHERAHLERHDAGACLLFGLGQAVFYPLPWFWWLRRQVRLCQEYVADAAAAAAGGLPEDYAQFLLSWTAAPALPAGVTGVLGHSSDLFRRVTMLLQTPAPVERRCPRRWSLAAAAGLLAAAVIAAGLGRPAAAAPAADLDKKPIDVDKKPADLDKKKDKKDAPRDQRNELPKRTPADINREMERMLRQGDFQPDDVRKLLDDILNDKEMQDLLKDQQQTLRQLQQMQRMLGGGGLNFNALPNAFPGAAPLAVQPGRFGEGAFGGGRLGARVAKPNPTLADQLDLPKGQGLVLEDVQADSAAAKAGLKTHDILLEMDGKPVSDDPAKFVRELQTMKSDKGVDAVVLRRGKRETVKGLKLPEARAARPGFEFRGVQPPNFPNPAAMPNFPGANNPLPQFAPPAVNLNVDGVGGFRGAGVMTTTVRTDDRFTTRHQEGSLIITLTGKVADGKAAVGTIAVQDGRETNKYESVDKVPEQYRDKVKNLVDQVEQNKTRIDIKTK